MNILGRIIDIWFEFAVFVLDAVIIIMIYDTYVFDWVCRIIVVTRIIFLVQFF